MRKNYLPVVLKNVAKMRLRRRDQREPDTLAAGLGLLTTGSFPLLGDLL